MKINEIIEKLTLIFRDIFTEPALELTSEMTANDVEKWDSLTHMLMVAEVEKQFGIKFKLKDLNKMKNVGSLISIIEEKSA
ncbi:acyl carrier protein [uncultured Sanguibacteroides sp.]|uniref:acyl carrier protein n=1 Tax=uncultured Sanguibacteroides sp. TaxID=1635151 RepID=UPI0025DB1C02|nr:acyl carrier protein [uncultured Sanguibacteroides sp.]